MSLPLPPISKHEESNSPMKNSHLDTSSQSEKQNAPLANQQKSESGASTRQTSSYQTESSSNLKDDLHRLIGPNLLLSDPNIPKSTYDCYSSKTTTQQNSSVSGTPTGPQSRDFNGPLGKSYPMSGEPADPTSALRRQVNGDHYKNFKIQPIEFIHKNGIGFAEGNVIKYVCRYAAKDGIKDLEKAKHYIELLIEMERAQ